LAIFGRDASFPAPWMSAMCMRPFGMWNEIHFAAASFLRREITPGRAQKSTLRVRVILSCLVAVFLRKR